MYPLINSLGIGGWTEREEDILTYIGTNALMCNQPNKSIVLDCLVHVSLFIACHSFC